MNQSRLLLQIVLVALVTNCTLASLLTPITNDNIHEAAKAWCNDSATATVIYGPIGEWDVSEIKDMGDLFYASNVPGAEKFNDDISSWKTGSVTNMHGMFQGASSFNQPLPWDTASVTDMYRMFHTATKFNQPLPWDTSSVTNMHHMFYQALAFNHPLNWDVSSVETMDSMFHSASSFNQPIASWDVASTWTMDYMFYNATAFNQPVNSWDVSSLATAYNMFRDAKSFDQDLNNWDVSILMNMMYMFNEASKFSRQLCWDIPSGCFTGGMLDGTAGACIDPTCGRADDDGLYC